MEQTPPTKGVEGADSFAGEKTREMERSQAGVGRGRGSRVSGRGRRAVRGSGVYVTATRYTPHSKGRGYSKGKARHIAAKRGNTREAGCAVTASTESERTEPRADPTRAGGLQGGRADSDLSHHKGRSETESFSLRSRSWWAVTSWAGTFPDRGPALPEPSPLPLCFHDSGSHPS